MEVVYRNGDHVKFLHVSKYADDMKVGGTILEGQIIAYSGNTGKDRKGKQYAVHLHVDANDAQGKSVNPETRGYGDYTNEEFFGEYNGDYTQLPANEGSGKEQPFVPQPHLFNLGYDQATVDFFRSFSVRQETIFNESMKVASAIRSARENQTKKTDANEN